MARINIEDSWWIDIRRSALIRLLNDEEKADGSMVRLWRTALNYWKKGETGIPKPIFDLLPCSQEILKCRLAAVLPDGCPTELQRVYVAGSNENFRWITLVKDQRKIAGKRSAMRPRDAKGRLLSSNHLQRDIQRNPTESNTRSNEKSNGANEIQLSSSSSSSSIKNTYSGIPYGNPTTQPSLPLGDSVGRLKYSPEFEEVWGLYGTDPRKRGDKKAAYEVFKRLKLSIEEIGKLKSAIQIHMADCRRGTEPVFYKHFCRFLKTDWYQHLAKPIPNGHIRSEAAPQTKEQYYATLQAKYPERD